jgi:hypothetical protein
MKLKDYRFKINSYFDTITPDAVIELFEDLSHLFTDVYSFDEIQDLNNVKERMRLYFIKIKPDEFMELGYEFIESENTISQ